jgi:hypothetical protein
MEITLIVGALGAVMTLMAFVLSSLGKLSRGNYRYMALNGSGAFLLLLYAVISNAVIFAILNIIWISVEIYYLIKKLLK